MRVSELGKMRLLKVGGITTWLKWWHVKNKVFARKLDTFVGEKSKRRVSGKRYSC